MPRALGRLPRLFAVLLICILPGACSHGGPSPSAILLPGAGTAFTPADLAGAWLGILDPAPPLNDKLPFFIRHDPSGFPFHARDGLGNIYDAADALIDVMVLSAGQVRIVLEQQTGQRAYSLVLDGQMNPSGTLHEGSYTLFLNGVLNATGHYRAVPSSGPGRFQDSMLDGTWSGRGVNLRNPLKGARVTLELESGSVKGGEVEDLHVFVVDGPNTSIFFLADDEVGLLENIVVAATDLTQVSMDYLLLDGTGTILAGAVADLWRPGVLRLQKQWRREAIQGTRAGSARWGASHRPASSAGTPWRRARSASWSRPIRPTPK